MPKLCWRHHTLIQALLSRGPLSEKDFHSLFSKVTGKSPGSLFNEYLRMINEELAYVQFELRACRNQYDGKVFYGVVNNVSDDQSRLGTKYSLPQIAFYKGIAIIDEVKNYELQDCMDSPRWTLEANGTFSVKSAWDYVRHRKVQQIEAIVQDAAAPGCISNIDGLHIQLENQLPAGADSQSQGGSTQIPAAFRNFSMSQKEKTLGELVRDQWLSLTDGKLGLGVRSFLDLRSWFRINEVPPCEVCNEAVVKGEVCKKEGCNVRIHHYCLRMKFSQSRAEKVCPGCGTGWDFIIAKEPIKEEDASAAPETQQPRVPSTRKRPRACAGGTDSEIPESSQRMRVPRKSTRNPESRVQAKIEISYASFGDHVNPSI